MSAARPLRRPAAEAKAAAADDGAALLARLDAFAGWVAPEIALPDVPPPALAALVAAGAAETWPGRNLVRAVPPKPPAETPAAD